MNISKFIDHTILKPEATESDIKRLVKEAMEFEFWACCVNQCWIRLVAEEIKGTGIKVCSVVGFPLGAAVNKAEESAKCVELGADELDMVMNIGFLKSGRFQEVAADICQVVKAANGRVVKVILETGVLTNEEKLLACRLVQDSGANFVKTSTGFGIGGATIEDVKLMRRAVGPTFGVKASGGIRTYKQVVKLIEAGASRIGTSAGVQIVKQSP
ncbi:MAG: deoxyribose-phosphate aldolase [Candidatus Stahlbacteria bacterium]|nr:deoxyribose-phosphate aldolase [Candidatus Stahlbacteria bacterium]